MKNEGSSFALLLIFFIFPTFCDACLCKARPTLAEEFNGSRAVFTGKVIYTNRNLQLKRMTVLQKFSEVTNTSPKFDIGRIRENGVSVTFRIFNSWKRS
jgi:hypothetical protein